MSMRNVFSAEFAIIDGDWHADITIIRPDGIKAVHSGMGSTPEDALGYAIADYEKQEQRLIGEPWHV
jgi:hypothetical protein